MELDKLLAQVKAIRRVPLQVVCRTPAGELVVTTVENCARQGYRYYHIVADDLDALLDKELNHRA